MRSSIPILEILCLCLLGDFGCGWWVVTFPGVAKEPWGVDGHWHVDGYGYKHKVDSPQIGCLPIFIFNDLGSHDGGTLLSSGSHKQVSLMRPH